MFITMKIKKYIPAFFSGFDDEYYEIHNRNELLNSELCKNWINSGYQICFSKDNDSYGNIMAFSPANNEDGAKWYVVSIINNKQDIDTLIDWLPDWNKLVQLYKQNV